MILLPDRVPTGNLTNVSGNQAAASNHRPFEPCKRKPGISPLQNGSFEAHRCLAHTLERHRYAKRGRVDGEDRIPKSIGDRQQVFGIIGQRQSPPVTVSRRVIGIIEEDATVIIFEQPDQKRKEFAIPRQSAEKIQRLTGSPRTAPQSVRASREFPQFGFGAKPLHDILPGERGRAGFDRFGMNVPGTWICGMCVWISRVRRTAGRLNSRRSRCNMRFELRFRV